MNFKLNKTVKCHWFERLRTHCATYRQEITV